MPPTSMRFRASHLLHIVPQHTSPIFSQHNFSQHVQKLQIIMEFNVQKGSCACMCNWTGVGSSLTTAGQVKYLFLSVQRLEAL